MKNTKTTKIIKNATNANANANAKKSKNISEKTKVEKVLSNGLTIGWTGFSSKDRKNERKAFANVIASIDLTKRTNENGASFSIKISNEILENFKKSIVPFTSDLFDLKMKKVDDFSIKQCISDAYISTYRLDFRKLTKKDKDYLYTFGIANYQFFKAVVFSINQKANQNELTKAK